jgi:hypothetical protein
MLEYELKKKQKKLSLFTDYIYMGQQHIIIMAKSDINHRNKIKYNIEEAVNKAGVVG